MSELNEKLATAWEGFTKGDWQNEVNVRDFIQKNYTPYEGDESEESRRWLASCGLTVEQMQNQMDPVYTPARKIHLYHCDHRGL
ncbi:hypothetical protein, partial [Escherichia coli]